MSASSTTPAATPGGSASTPAQTELLIPSACRGFTTNWQGIETSAARTASASCPRTTTSGSRPARCAVRTARRTTVSPLRSNSSLLRPIRRDEPAARTTPATGPDRSGRIKPSTSALEHPVLLATLQSGTEAKHILGQFVISAAAHRSVSETANGNKGEQAHVYIYFARWLFLSRAFTASTVHARAGNHNALILSRCHLAARFLQIRLLFPPLAQAPAMGAGLLVHSITTRPGDMP